MKKSTGIAVATAVAGLFIAGSVMAEAAKTGAAASAPAPAKKVMCEGVNSCKGKGACGGKDGCKGKNGCKGKGMSEMGSEEECTKAGGKVKKS
jgi:hypothetical protein